MPCSVQSIRTTNLAMTCPLGFSGRDRTSARQARSSHLLERALERRLVLAPAQDLGAVPDTSPTRVVVGHLDHQFGAELDPLEILFALPAARIAVAALAGLVGLEL